MPPYFRPFKTAFILLSLGISLPAFAQDAPVETIKKDAPQSRTPSVRGPVTAIRPAALWMAGLDADHDYVITRAEFEAGLRATFAALDTNNDKRLSLFDLEDWRKKALGSNDATPHVLQFDNDYNSTITRAEFDATLTGLFMSADKNADKTVTFDELVSVIERPQKRQRSEQNERSRPGQQRPRGRR